MISFVTVFYFFKNKTCRLSANYLEKNKLLSCRHLLVHKLYQLARQIVFLDLLADVLRFHIHLTFKLHMMKDHD